MGGDTVGLGFERAIQALLAYGTGKYVGSQSIQESPGKEAGMG